MRGLREAVIGLCKLGLEGATPGLGGALARFAAGLRPNDAWAPHQAVAPLGVVSVWDHHGRSS